VKGRTSIIPIPNDVIEEFTNNDGKNGVFFPVKLLGRSDLNFTSVSFWKNIGALASIEPLIRSLSLSAVLENSVKDKEIIVNPENFGYVEKNLPEIYISHFSTLAPLPSGLFCTAPKCGEIETSFIASPDKFYFYFHPKITRCDKGVERVYILVIIIIFFTIVRQYCVS
jgi:hypothetical protein